MSYLATNLDYLLHKHRLSANELQSKSEITQSTTSRILSGKTTNPRQDIIKKYAEYFGVSEQDLIFTDLSRQDKTSHNEPNGILSDKQIEVWTDGDTPPDGMIAIDFLPNITASLGHGYINEEFTEKTQLWFSEQTLRKCNVNPKYAQAIHVAGDSMLPELSDGQVIAIDTSATRIFDGEIYAFRKGDEIKVKYLFKTNDGFKAISRNDDKLRYPDEFYTTTDIENENIEILGQFWWKSETRRIKR